MDMMAFGGLYQYRNIWLKVFPYCQDQGREWARLLSLENFPYHRLLRKDPHA